MSVPTGTIFQDTRKPLRLWFYAMWWVVGQQNGASAVGLNRVLGIGSDKTAWTWLHKLRRAMVRPGREPLTGKVEVDETFVGGVEQGGVRRHLVNKALVVIAAEIRGNGIGRIRMKRIADGSSDRVTTFAREAVEKGGVVVREGLPSYRSLPAHGDRHTRRIVEGRAQEASALLPRVHRVASLLKRWLLGTHQGAVSREHLDSDLDEFAFRSGPASGRCQSRSLRGHHQACSRPAGPKAQPVGITQVKIIPHIRQVPYPRPKSELIRLPLVITSQVHFSFTLLKPATQASRQRCRQGIIVA